ncbi:EamA/RhaT family transporter [Halobacteriales archaeon QS_8_69_26]|nr:MAG: EamA/RhaT family transporter [Halobacteriales archaeon QS_8_69_26]
MAALAVAVAAVSTSAILVRWSRAPSLIKAFYRVLFMAALVAPVALSRNRAALRVLSRRDLAVAAATGAALAVHFASWFASVQRTSVAASVTLVQSQPLFVAVGAYLVLDERIDRWVVAGILLAVGGAAVMSLGDPGATVPVQGQALLGNALAVLGAVMMAGYVLVGRSLRQRIPLFPYVTVVYAAAAVVLLLAVVGSGTPLVGYPPREYLLFLGMAVGPGIFGHTVVNWALEHVESSVVSVTLLGEPVGSTLLAVALLSEVPSAATVAGGTVVLAGIYVTVRAREHWD